MKFYSAVALCLLCCVVFVSGLSPAGAQFALFNDTVKTEPLMKIKVDVVHKDSIDCENYTWRILAALDPIAQGTAVQDGDNILFMPGVGCRNDTIDIRYGVACDGVELFAALTVIVSEYCLPVNLIDPSTSCTYDVPSNIDFEVALKYIADNQDWALDGFSIPLVGDLDGDGKPEIVALGLANYDGGAGLDAYGRYIMIFNGQTGKRILQHNIGDDMRLRSPPRHNSPSRLAIADMNRNGRGEIVVATTMGNVICLELDRASTGADVLTEKWRNTFKPVPSSGLGNDFFSAPLPYIADIDADGIAEVIVYNKIFNGVTGTLRCELETLAAFAQPASQSAVKDIIDKKYAYVGRQPLTPNGDQFTPCIAVADIDGDGMLDIVAGSKVYRMKRAAGGALAYDIIAGPSSVAVKTDANYGTSTNVFLADGFTCVADIDMDGSQDVIVINMVKVSGDNHTYILYVWDPLKNPAACKAAMLLYEDGWEGYISYPFFGDINGKRDSKDGLKMMPELCFLTGRIFTKGGHSSTPVKPHPLSTGTDNKTHFTADSKGYISNPVFNSNLNPAWTEVSGFVFALTWHADAATPIEERLKMSWALEVLDRSQMTGISMFDFDGDGAMDLCYKDENSVRVISPSKRNYIPISVGPGAGSPVRFQQDNVYSYTGYEAPVVADLNMDGSADIVTMSRNDGKNQWRSRGYIFVWEHKPGSDKWAPCPPVWNQAIYNPRLVNGDLTVPPFPQPWNTVYVNANGDTILPYGGQWIQQPAVREGELYKPAGSMPDAMLTNMTVAVAGSETVIKLTVKNAGSASINSATPVTFYHAGVRNSGGYTLDDPRTVRIQTAEIGEDIFPNTTAVRTFRIPQKLNNTLIIARVSDNGNKTVFPAKGFDDCHPANNSIDASDCISLPYSITPLPSTEFCPFGDTATIVVASGIPTPHRRAYRWYRNGRIVAGAADSILKITRPGVYKCHVSEDICRFFTPEVRMTKGVSVLNPDYVATMTTEPVEFRALSNDVIPPACVVAPVIVDAPARGQARMQRDSIVYVPNAGFAGIDSMTYAPCASPQAPSGKVVVAVLKPAAAEYFACPAALATLKMIPIQGVEYSWYDRATGGSPLASRVDSIVVAKTADPVQSFWVEAHIGGNVASRVRIELKLSSDCGLSPSTCSAHGTLLFREDFGGNGASAHDPARLASSHGTTACTYDPNLAAPDSYRLTKEMPAGFNGWLHYGDNTSPANLGAGYLMAVGASPAPTLFYTAVVNDLCANMRLHFSVRAGNLRNGSKPAAIPADPMLKFVIQDEMTGAILAEFFTGALPAERQAGVWRLYGFEFVAAHADIRLSVFNAAKTNSALVLDDIELRFCAPPATVSQPAADISETCDRGLVTLAGSYSDDGTFGAGLVGRWEHNATDDLHNPLAWMPVAGSEVASPGNRIDVVHSFYADSGSAGHYRLAVANAAAMPNGKCRAVSRIIRLDMSDRYVPPDIRLIVRLSPTLRVELSSCLDSLDFNYTVEWTPRTYGAALVQGTERSTGEIDLSAWHAHSFATFTYDIASTACGTQRAKAFVSAAAEHDHTMEVEICRTPRLNHRVNLNRITGIASATGQWDWTNIAGAVFDAAITEVAAGRYAGAKFFDADAAFAAATDPSYIYAGNPNKKKFEFEYRDGGIRQRVVLIVE
ncbi:MAG: hypothetical protein LBD35_05915 [Prevotellaceae bacterium]|jgi:hypothetical protein|nr:hypothetical protein [Prevotellaceae bacterium]